jgi:hypothetical protein
MHKNGLTHCHSSPSKWDLGFAIFRTERTFSWRNRKKKNLFEMQVKREPWMCGTSHASEGSFDGGRGEREQKKGQWNKCRWGQKLGTYTDLDQDSWVK